MNVKTKQSDFCSVLLMRKVETAVQQSRGKQSDSGSRPARKNFSLANQGKFDKRRREDYFLELHDRTVGNNETFPAYLAQSTHLSKNSYREEIFRHEDAVRVRCRSSCTLLERDHLLARNISSEVSRMSRTIHVKSYGLTWKINKESPQDSNNHVMCLWQPLFSSQGHRISSSPVSAKN